MSTGDFKYFPETPIFAARFGIVGVWDLVVISELEVQFPN